MRLILMFSFAAVMTAGSTVKAEDKPTTDSHEQVAKDAIKNMKSATKALTDAIDKATAEKSKPELEKAVAALAGLDARMTALGKATKEKEAELEKKFKPELDEAVKALQAQYARISKEPFGKDLLAVLQKKPQPAKDKPKEKGTP